MGFYWFEFENRRSSIGGHVALRARGVAWGRGTELELELIHAHMAQKPVLRLEVGARALRSRHNQGKDMRFRDFSAAASSEEGRRSEFRLAPSSLLVAPVYPGSS